MLIGKNSPSVGVAPSIILTNPKYSHNVGMVLRLASCFDLKQVWFTGDRVKLDGKERLPREERMRGYKDVDLIQYDYPFDQFKNCTPIAIEVREDSEPLHSFEHPENPVYVFGPEDGSIPKPYLLHCHRFVVIPTKHCLNLATAVSTVLWDRQVKNFLNGSDYFVTPGLHENRGYDEFSLLQ